ncbi:MAG: succinate dehydrogenase assembly factor 2 [Proteobacteria bacterium]|nr:succinate dehydrogenase assembly factor 2 [Pseudomonadota bacterium]
MPVNDAQLRWQCRRGMRELDILLTNYFESDYLQASEEQKQAFRELLALPDPDLIGYLLGGQSPPEAALANVVKQIRNRPQA